MTKERSVCSRERRLVKMRHFSAFCFWYSPIGVSAPDPQVCMCVVRGCTRGLAFGGLLQVIKLLNNEALPLPQLPTQLLSTCSRSSQVFCLIQSHTIANTNMHTHTHSCAHTALQQGFILNPPSPNACFLTVSPCDVVGIPLAQSPWQILQLILAERERQSDGGNERMKEK